jgi:zinc-ribbon domain
MSETETGPFCTQCGARLAEDARFCSSCGVARRPGSGRRVPAVEADDSQQPPYWPPPPGWDAPERGGSSTQRPASPRSFVPRGPQPRQSSRIGRWWQWVLVALVVLIAIGVATNHSGGDSSSSSSLASASADSSSISGKVSGHFKTDCFLCSGRLYQDIDVSDAWCAWDGANVIVHVTMTNNSVEHVTVHWHPSYVIAGGDEHGTGLTSIQDDGFDSGETRELAAKQKPQGVATGSPIETCKPSFNSVDSG